MSATRVYLTGTTGFVGGNVARVFAERERAELFCPVHRMPPPDGAPYAWERLDLTDAGATAARLGARLPTVRELLGRMRAEVDSVEVHA